MRMAVDEARKCLSKAGPTPHPLVGAVAVSDSGELIGSAYRGEPVRHNGRVTNDHAEFTLIEKKLKGMSLVGATIYTTLEPCTVRNPPKLPCVKWLVDGKVRRVVIGMWDPNPLIRGLGCRELRRANVVTQMFDHDFMSDLEALNRHFIQHIEAVPEFLVAQEIGTLVRRGTDRQQEAARAVLMGSVESLRQINKGEIRLSGGEPEYFQRLLSCVKSGPAGGRGRGFIRLTAFLNAQNFEDWRFRAFLNEWKDLLTKKKITFSYIFLLKNSSALAEAQVFIDQYVTFAREVSLIYQDNLPESQLPNLENSIVLLEKQKIAFTHNRKPSTTSTTVFGATEWTAEEQFGKLSDLYDRIKLTSSPYFSSDVK
jgi:pyrimidine deaminase RibD-like protein